jgi:hypothetical protein
MEKVAGAGVEMTIGYLSHCGVYVVASQPPTYSKQEEGLQGLRKALKTCAAGTLQILEGNYQRYEL